MYHTYALRSKAVRTSGERMNHTAVSKPIPVRLSPSPQPSFHTRSFQWTLPGGKHQKDLVGI
ncbi:hypothetical protein X975_05072, partial [Stegodyphus mimosarum]